MTMLLWGFLTEVLRRCHEPEVEAEVRQRLADHDFVIAGVDLADKLPRTFNDYPFDAIPGMVDFFFWAVVLGVLTVIGWDGRWMTAVPFLFCLAIILTTLVYTAAYRPSMAAQIRYRLRVATTAQSRGYR
jgi:hypothetical protein